MGIQKSRAITVYSIIAVLLSVLIGFLVWATCFNASTMGSIGAYTTTVDAPRGEILDRNGAPLVTNRQGNSITFDASAFPDSKHMPQRNEEIISLIQLCEANNIEYIHNLPIVVQDGKYVFQIEDKEGEAYAKWLKSPDMLNLNSYATAENCMKVLIDRYELEGYSKEDALKVAAVQAEMNKMSFGPNYPYTFAKDVPIELITIIMENSTFYKGVKNTVVPYREYTDGALAPHLLGRVNNITAEKYQSEREELEKKLKKANGKEDAEQIQRDAYTYTDEFGTSGIEGAMEEYLRGHRGVKSVTTDENGKRHETYPVEPVQGDSVILTIDSNLQQVAQDALAKRVRTLGVSSARRAAAACVVENVNTGEILACATYPSYDNSTWKENYSDWAQDPNTPLWNRAVSSVYEPGSTFKPCTAIAALETGTINAGWYYTCGGKYKYGDHVFECAHGTAHGTNNVVGAIDKSCNCFFYETGRRLGIEKIDEWATNFGLGQKTGVEIPEATGQVASPEERKARGGIWYPGDTITAAIGESDNQFTLLQLANYCATLANGGTRYKPHFVKSIMSADYKTTVLDKEPVITQQLKLDPNNLALVKEGMLRVGTTGFCRAAFSGLPVRAAAKTGTSDVVKIVNGRVVPGNNGFLISFAPYEKPEISVAIVVETANAGALTADVAAEIYKYYFSAKSLQTAESYNTLLA